MRLKPDLLFDVGRIGVPERVQVQSDVHPDLPPGHGRAVGQGDIRAEGAVFGYDCGIPFQRYQEMQIGIVEEHLLRRAVSEPLVCDYDALGDAVGLKDCVNNNSSRSHYRSQTVWSE